MKFQATEIFDVKLIIPDIFEDERGFFLETYREEDFFQAGINHEFVQDNHSGSLQGVLRGLHFQILKPQGKLIRAVVGEIFDVAVDLRHDSSTFGKWVGTILSSKNKSQIWIPPFFAHGYYVLSEMTEILYKTTDYYSPENERSILWNDTYLDINWPLLNGQQPILSERDKLAPTFENSEYY